MKARLALLTLLGLGLWFAADAHAWWDTWVRMQTSEPCVSAFQAVDLVGAQDIRDDAQANAGRGGKTVYVKPGQLLTFKMDLKPSVYTVWIIARADEAEYKPAEKHEVTVDFPSGPGKFETIRPLVFSAVETHDANGKSRRWSMPIPYEAKYGIVSKLYVPVHAAGMTTFSVGLDAKSAQGLLVQRIELRDVLGYTVRRAFKDARVLTTDEQLADLRKRYADDPKKRTQWPLGRREFRDTYTLPAERTPAQRREAAETLWNSLPDWNAMACDPAFRTWHHVIGRDTNGKVKDLAEIYEQTGSPEAGWDAAVMLAALAEKYPGMDHYYQYAGGGPHNRMAEAQPLRWGQSMGKSVYSGWAGGDLTRLAQAYDKIFDYLRGNQALADFLHTRIDWIQTPQDVVRFLDVYLLQHGMDCVNRHIIRNEEARALCRRLLCLTPDTALPAESVFTRPLWEEDEADSQFCDQSRGGVSYIGSTLYVGYGEPKNMLCCAGGFPVIIGDAMDQRVGRREQWALPEYPSRIYEGFGAVILEDGQGETNPRLRRALAIHTGIGRGHAHQDALNLELFAHGCRLLPDLGGRHEGKNHAAPNMRWSRMHNMVVIDNKNFENLFPGSTTSATGWTTSFSPQPGVQYTCNTARATSHPDVSVYERATAMIDAGATPDAGDVYVFDVFRVQGGQEHSYCFHGACSDHVETNATLTKATSEEAARILHKRPEESWQEGACPEALVMTWPLKSEEQKRYQGESHQPDRPVGLTLTLFGHGQDRLYLGGATSPVYPVDLPYLHVTGKQEKAGRASVYPALLEAHAGPRFITEAMTLRVTPATTDAVDAGVAVSVRIGERQDLLFASRRADLLHEVEGGAKIQGEFGFISRDAQGLRTLHLVGGTRLELGEVALTCEQPLYEASIKTLDPKGQALTLSTSLPARLLDSQYARIGNPEHWDTFQTTLVDGTSATLAKDPCYYQAHVLSVDEAAGIVSAEIEPKVFGCDTRYCTGTTASNEAGDKFWKAAYAPQERWMYLGWPNTDLSYPRVVRMDDVPDTNGDGRHVLKLMASGGYNNDLKIEEPAGTVMLELEVTRVDPEHFMFYFKLPEDARYQSGGWQFANRELVNEDGSRCRWATYPGTTYTWELTGAEKPRLADFTDADGDGRRKLRAYAFGPGDTLQWKTFVYVRREAADLFQIRANVPCTVTLPGSIVEMSTDKKDFRTATIEKTGKTVRVGLSAGDLGRGSVWIRVQP